MRRFAKFVAGVLVALSALPALATAPCRQAMHSMKCCSSTCPMTAQGSGVKIAGSKGPEITSPACCSPSSQRAIAFADQRMAESGIDLALLHSQPTDPYAVAAERPAVKRPRQVRSLGRPSRTALCTFLI